MRITVSKSELESGKLNQENLQSALDAIQETGFAILKDIVRHDHLDILRDKMTEDSLRMIQDERWGGSGRTKGHLQQGPPPLEPYVFPDVAANPIVEHVTSSLFGSGAFNSFYNGNTNTPGSETQPLHMDTGHLWPNRNPSHPTHMVVVNISPLDTTEENGAVELWPGTHLIGDVGRGVSPEDEAKRRAEVPPVRGTAPKGSALIRDMRLWHRGVPNRSDQIRHMIALVHCAGWLRRGRPLRYGPGCESAFENAVIDPNAVFLEEPHDYLFDYIGPNQ